MQALTTIFLLPDWISAGLSSGLYERMGGAIRETGTKQVWHIFQRLSLK